MTPAVEFRLANLQDVALIRDLVWAAYSRWVPIIGREPLPMRANYEQTVQEHDVDLLNVAGTMVGLIETQLHPDHFWIENIAVAPDSQGKGWGRKLLEHAEGKASLAGRGELRLLTNEAFGNNVALYKAIGYSIDRTEPFMGGTTVYMSKLCTPLSAHSSHLILPP